MTSGAFVAAAAPWARAPTAFGGSGAQLCRQEQQPSVHSSLLGDPNSSLCLSLSAVATGSLAAHVAKKRSRRSLGPGSVVLCSSGRDIGSMTVDKNGKRAGVDNGEEIPPSMVGEARWSDPEMREKAFEYLAARRKLSDKFTETEEEWVRLACYAMDVAGSMELAEEKDQLEAELEEMKQKEQEVATWMEEIREVRRSVDQEETSLAQLQEKVAQAKQDCADVHAELKQSKDAVSSNESELSTLRETRLDYESQVQAARDAASKLVDQRTQVAATIEELKERLSEQQRIAEPRRRELLSMQAEILELEDEGQQLEAQTKKEAEELSAAKAKVESLRAAIAEAKAQTKSVSQEKLAVHAQVDKLPKDLEAAQEAVRALEQDVTNLKEQLAPKKSELASLQQAGDALKDTIGDLHSQTSRTEQSIQSETARSQQLAQEKLELESDLEVLVQKQQDAEAERARMEALLPALREKRANLPSQVNESVRLARVAGLDLQIQAKEVKQWLQNADLEGTLSKESAALSGKANEIMAAAQQVTDAQRRAEEAFEKALAERRHAEAGMLEFQKAMEQRLVTLHSQEKLLSDTLEEHKRIDSKMSPLVQGVEEQLSRFNHVANEVEELKDAAKENSKEDFVVQAAGGIGWALGSILKASKDLAPPTSKK